MNGVTVADMQRALCEADKTVKGSYSWRRKYPTGAQLDAIYNLEEAMKIPHRLDPKTRGEAADRISELIKCVHNMQAYGDLSLDWYDYDDFLAPFQVR